MLGTLVLRHAVATVQTPVGPRAAALVVRLHIPSVWSLVRPALALNHAAMRGHGHRCRHGLASHAAIAVVAHVAFAIAPAIAAVVAARIASPTSPALGRAILAVRVARAAARCSVRAHLSAGGYGGAEQGQHQCSTGGLGERFDFHGNAFHAQPP